MRYKPNSERRAVILMVVLSLLTLFAIVGISFVLYAQAEAASARVARQAETQQRADVDPQQALAFFLNQLIYDVPDSTGSGSALRGHSLARTMYGWNGSSNSSPYGGVGRLHTNGTTWPYMNPWSIDDYQLINYTWFQGDNFARDPEWYGNLKTTPGAGQGTSAYYVGANAPYTYPDLNNLFLAAVNSSDTVLTPSFHRPWLFGSLAQSNPNWSGPQGKYMTLRPRPNEHPNFPYPDDLYGDVKNLAWTAGGNDSIWIDIGAPVMTAPDGTLYKMLVAPLIMDLDNRLHVGAAGNITGNPNGNTSLGNISHRSNQGWFSTEVNLSKLWATNNNPAVATDWLNLFLGYLPGTPRTATTPPVPPTGYYGKYGQDLLPSGSLFAAGSPAHFYAQADLDGRNELNNGALTGSIFLPGTNASAPGTIPFPYFPQGYGSGSPAERSAVDANGNVYYMHPAAYPGGNDIVFRASDMELMLRPNSLGTTAVDSGSSALASYLTRLCPNSLGTNADLAQRRNWLTTISAALVKAGVAPWVYDPTNAASYSTAPTAPFPYAVNAATPSLPPLGGTIAFPAFAQRQTQANNPPPSGSDFSTTAWRSAIAGQARLDLNPTLTPFPHMSSGGSTALTNTPNDRFDVANPINPANTAAVIMAQFTSAMQARQSLALSIYNNLVAITGVAPLSNTVTPAVTDLAPRRWLAQLAVNIVDYIDDDEISTPFNFFDPNNNGNPSPVTGNNAAGNNPNIAYQVDAPLNPPANAPNNTTVTPTVTTVPTNGFYDYPLPPPNPQPNSNYYPSIGGNPDVPAYWVFGTELPRIVINEVMGEYTVTTDDKTTPPLAVAGTFNVNLWVELFNPLPPAASVTATATANGSTLQAQDTFPVPLYMPLPANATPGLNPYNIYQLVIANNNTAANTAGNTVGLWYNALGMNNNVLGTPQQLRYTTPPTAAIPGGVPAICNFSAGGGPAVISSPGGLAGQSYLLVGPSPTDVNNDITLAAGVPAGTPLVASTHMTYQVNFTPTPAAGQSQWSIATPPPPGSPPMTPPVPLSINDNTNGVSVLLRRLANPHLPPNPFMANGTLTIPAMPPNPYITVDYATGMPLNGYGFDNTGKLFPISQFTTPPILLNNSPAPAPPPAPPLTGGPGSYGKLQPYAACNDPNAPQYALQTTVRKNDPLINISAGPPAWQNHHTLGLPNTPIASPFTWLVHPDRILISPMELLHVSGFHPHELTQRFIYPATIPNPAVPPTPPTIPNPQLVSQPYTYTGAAGVPANSAYFQHYAPWFDQSRRLYRLFELLDTNISASTLSNGGVVAGKININTLWDQPTVSPICQALADPSTTPDNPQFNSGIVQALFQTLLASRTPNIATGTLSANDRPFVGMAAGVAPAGDLQYPNGMGIDNTLLTGSATAGTVSAPTTARLLQLPSAASIQTTHPYLQNQLLTKVFSRLTTRSNVFAVFVTVGFFQVTGTVAGSANIPQLGPEIGRSEGRQIRHRMFAIVDRSQLTAYAGPKVVYDPRLDPLVVPYFSIID